MDFWFKEEQEYEHEYELERFTVAGRLSLEVLAVVPSPLEYMATLHTKMQEIRGCQVWLCHVPCANVTHAVVCKATEDAGFTTKVYDSQHIFVEDCPLQD